MSEPKRGVEISIHPLGCIFWLIVFLLFVGALNWIFRP